MLGKFSGSSADVAGAETAADARSKAPALMSEALGHLDSDCNIPAIIGAQLQTAIDALWTTVSVEQAPTNLP